MYRSIVPRSLLPARRAFNVTGLSRATAERVGLSRGPLRALSTTADLTDRQKRILYRCKQRGLLELDMLMGTWADQHIRSLSPAHLDQLEELSLAESPQMLKYVLQSDPVPEELNNDIMKKLQDYAQSTKKTWNPKK